MKSGARWNLRGLRPEARAAAIEAARRSGMSVGEWLNTVIKPARQSGMSVSEWLNTVIAPAVEEDDERWWVADWEREADDPWRRRFREDAPQRRRPDYRRARRRDHEPADSWPAHAEWEEGDDDRDLEANWPRRDRRLEDRETQQSRYDYRGAGRRSDTDWRVRDWDSNAQRPRGFHHDDQQQYRPRRDRHYHDDDDQDAPPVRREGRPYRNARHHESVPYREGWGREAVNRAHEERKQYDTYDEYAAGGPPDVDSDSSIERAIAEIRARQQALDHNAEAKARRSRDGGPAAEIRPPHRGPQGEAAANIKSAQHPRESETAAEIRLQQPSACGRGSTDITAPQRPLEDEAPAEVKPPQRAAGADVAANINTAQSTLDDDVVAEIKAAQRALASDEAGTSFGDRPPLPFSAVPQKSRLPVNENGQAENAGAPAVDLSGLERQLRQITTWIEALRPPSELETAINGLRTELGDIGRSLAAAPPRQALESLEFEIKALGKRIDHSRQSGIDRAALVGVERGLAEVREALRGLTPAEGLVGVDEAVTALAKKVDAIVTKDDPAALQQLETAIGSLRGIVSHVASNDTLTKVAQDVHALAVKIDELAANATSGPTLLALERRIDMLASALNASAEAGHAVPRELERLLSALVEKLERLQPAHTDQAALTHLENRIAMLMKRLDDSDARLGLLEGVERGLTGVLAHLERLRSTEGNRDRDGKNPVGGGGIERQVAALKQTEQRTQDSLEAVHGAVERVVDRLAVIGSDMRSDKARPGPRRSSSTQQPEPPTASQPIETASQSGAAPFAAAARGRQREPLLPQRATTARPPIDPNLPPDHPLEPGSTAGRPPQPPSTAALLAASEAVGSAKPLPDPSGGKSDFIASARRAAQAAATASSHAAPVARETTRSPKWTERLRMLVVAASIVVIALGGFHLVSRLFEDGGSKAPPRAQTEPPPRVLPEPSQEEAEPPPAKPEGQPGPDTVAPKANLTKSPMTIAVPPSGESPKDSGAAQPQSAAPATTSAGANRQSLVNPLDTPTSAGGTLPAKSAPSASGNGAAASWLPPEITSSLPLASAAHQPATTSTMTGGDKLPAAIGGAALHAAALAGDPAAAYEVGARFAEGRLVPPNNEEAARWFEVAAKKGLAPAQFRLGMLYEKGLGVRKDLARARDLYRAAADKGNGKAMHNLAVLYAEGVSGSADYRTAAQWFRKAAEHGITDSQYNLAVLYARGVGAEQNFAESYKWFFLAAKAGDQDAAQKRDEVAGHLDQRALASARLAAEQWTPVPQPADAVMVKVPEAWDAPGKGMSSGKPSSHSAGASVPDAAKVD